MSSYISIHNLYYIFQNEFRPGHSTDTALQKDVDDLFLSLNKGNMYILALLDFPSALYTIDHSILEHRLHTDFGLTDIDLQWYSSQMTDCTQYVSLSGYCSAFAPVHSCVPPGTVPGYMPFSIYIKPMFTITDAHLITHLSFADSILIMVVCNTGQNIRATSLYTVMHG